MRTKNITVEKNNMLNRKDGSWDYDNCMWWGEYDEKLWGYYMRIS